MPQAFAMQNQSNATPYTTAAFACAAASVLLICNTLNAATLSVLLLHVAVLTAILLVGLIIRLVLMQKVPHTEQS